MAALAIRNQLLKVSDNQGQPDQLFTCASA